MTAPRVPLKDQLFHRGKVALIAAQIHAVHRAFRRDAFVEQATERLAQLELKQRIAWIADCLRTHLPRDYRRAVNVLLGSLPAPCDPERTDGEFGDFIYATYSEFVAQRGRGDRDLEFSLAALKEITTRFSAEDAIRTFINAFPDRTMATLLAWTGDEHYHVRRLCSEGSRPRLPWARRLALPATAAIPILDRLFDDRTRFVTRSVANHLNDITKTDPDAVVQILRRWRDSGRQPPREMDYIVRHATRSAIKAGHPPTLALLGVSTGPHVTISEIMVPRHVDLDTELAFSVGLLAEEDAKVVVDYMLYFPGPSGEITRRKIYKLRQLTLLAGRQVNLTKRHPLQANMTTRKIYPGRHELEILINGAPHGRHPFWIRDSALPARPRQP
ncbi:MAG TPA: DNA alkylation repair protein [Candidatus Limnocylindrales bacterium]|nr:DNA alkylation repair protein [Candidatus Limnocylindrales bacterium]